MTGLQQTAVPNENTQVKDLLDLQERSTLLKLNCHHVAKLTAVDTLQQIASAQIVYKKTVYKFDETTGNNEPQLVDYPLVIDGPLIMLGGGNSALTFPVAVGDECLVLFNDRDIDNWFSSGGENAQNATGRLHSFADGFILVGVRSLPNVLVGYNADEAEFRTKDGTVKISPTADGVVVTTPALTATFRTEGGAFIENAIGEFKFEDNADVSFDTGTVVGRFGNGGKVKFENALGDLITAIYDIFTNSTAAGFPLIPNPAALAVLLSFKP